MKADKHNEEQESELERAQDRAEKGRNSAPKTDKAWEPTLLASAQEQIRQGRSTKNKKLEEVQNIVAAMGPPVPRQFDSVSQTIRTFQQELTLQAGVIAMMKAEQDQLRNRLDVADEELRKALSQLEQPEDQRVHIPMGKQSFGVKLVGTQCTIYAGSHRATGDKVIEFAETTVTLSGSVEWVYYQFTRGASSGTIEHSSDEPITGPGSQIVRRPLYKFTITGVANVWTLARDCRSDDFVDTGM